ARGFACRAVEQVRASHQSAYRPRTWHRGATKSARPRRRGDRVKRREFITLLGGAATTFPRSCNRAIRAASILPEILEPFRRQLGVAHRVLDVLVAEVVLQRARIDTLIRELVSAGMAQHVRMDRERHLGGLAEALDQLLKAIRRIGAPRSLMNT